MDSAAEGFSRAGGSANLGGRASKRIVLTTFGSFGDLHPYMALALGLKARGHQAIIATSAIYRDKIEAEGIGFHPVRPDLPPPSEATELLRRVIDMRKGPEYLLKQFLMPRLRESYEDLGAAVEGADLLVTHMITYAGPILAEERRIPWVSTVLAPLSFFSAFDPPVLAPAQSVGRLRPLGPSFHERLFRLAKARVRSWAAPIDRLREELGLWPAVDPFFEGQHSPELVLAMFSRVLGPPQPDWPPHTRQTGFVFFDHNDRAEGLSQELEEFLNAGPPPIIFTLGSSAVMDAGDFYAQSAAAARALGRRAVLLVGPDPRNRPDPLPEGMVALEYAPYSAIFPCAAAIVHPGGVGTTGQALRAGRPMLVMPFSHDQPDNAARLVRLDVARTIPRTRYSAERAARELSALLDDPSYMEKAEEVGRVARAEDGVGAACDAIEAVLRAVR